MRMMRSGASDLAETVPRRERLYMGLDPSLTGTGIAFIHAGRLKTFRLVPPAKMRGVERLDWLSVQMEETLSAYGPDQVAIEAYSFGSRNSHAHALGEAGGAFRLALYRRGVATIEVPPTSLKKFATGSGTAEKATVAKELYKRFGVDLSNNDEVDAAGLALACMAHDDPSGFPLTAAQREAMKKFQPIFATGCKISVD
jgi:crossover junction endodeoxyribonuclease RuvC